MPKQSKTFKGHTVEFKDDANSGNFEVTHNGNSQGRAKRVEVDVATFNMSDPNGTIIATSHNPTCFWYCYNGQWYVYCC